MWPVILPDVALTEVESDRELYFGMQQVPTSWVSGIHTYVMIKSTQLVVVRRVDLVKMASNNLEKIN